MVSATRFSRKSLPIIGLLAGILLPITVGLFPDIGYSHGVHHQILMGGIGIQAEYESGQPLIFCQVKVYTPDSIRTLYQEGYTNRHGQFLFAPDQPGDWTVEIMDGSGHGLVESISVTDSLLVDFPEENAELWWYQILAGISIIFGVTGILYGLKPKTV